MKACERCETPFKVTHPQKRFCSESCQRAAEKQRYRERHTEQAVCLNCGGSFERVVIGRRKKVYCSKSCQYERKSTLFKSRPDLQANIARARRARQMLLRSDNGDRAAEGLFICASASTATPYSRSPAVSTRRAVPRLTGVVAIETLCSAIQPFGDVEESTAMVSERFVGGRTAYISPDMRFGLLLLYLAVGVLVAAGIIGSEGNYFSGLSTLEETAEMVLAVLLWPLVLLDVNINIGDVNIGGGDSGGGSGGGSTGAAGGGGGGK